MFFSRKYSNVVPHVPASLAPGADNREKGKKKKKRRKKGGADFEYVR
jgi:hypothetical protein